MPITQVSGEYRKRNQPTLVSKTEIVLLTTVGSQATSLSHRMAPIDGTDDECVGASRVDNGNGNPYNYATDLCRLGSVFEQPCC
jgi:hypothetical protein